VPGEKEALENSLKMDDFLFSMKKITSAMFYTGFRYFDHYPLLPFSKKKCTHFSRRERRWKTFQRQIIRIAVSLSDFSAIP
jgi:hypothetical protein